MAVFATRKVDADVHGLKLKTPSIRIWREENPKASVGFLLFAF